MSAREREVDWSVLEYPGVRGVARKAASKVATDYSDLATVDYDDLYQEALILLATNGEAQDCLGDPDLGLGVLYHRIVCDLENTVSTEARRHVKQTSLDAALDAEQDPDPARPKRQTPDEPSTPGGDYSRELVEQLIPTLWDRSYAFGMTNPQAPDPDMPRATIDVSHGCTLYAHLADINTAWRRAPLTLKEKRAVLLRYGLGWDHREIGNHEGVSRQAITARLDAAVGKMRDHLNGVLPALTW